METIKDLIGLLIHHVNTLYSTEQQQVELLPLIIEKAHHGSLKNALNHHLELTKEQLTRLEKIPQLINDKIIAAKERSGTNVEFATVVINKQAVSKGMQGLTDEAKELLTQRLDKHVTDAAIIAMVQKIEHYEICTYGTAAAYARQLHLRSAEALLNETLEEEYDADDLLTALATASFNKEATPEGVEFLAALDFPEALDNSDTSNTDEDSSEAGKVIISERTVNSPGGRAGTSHRRYPSGESRGH